MMVGPFHVVAINATGRKGRHMRGARDKQASGRGRGPSFLWRLAVSTFFSALGTAALAAGAGAAMEAGWFRLRGITPGALRLYVAAGGVAGIVLQMIVVFLVPILSRQPRVTLLTRFKFLVAFPLLIAATATAGYLVLPEVQRNMVGAAAETLARETAREAGRFEARREAERAIEEVRSAWPLSARAICLLVAALAAAVAAGVLLTEIGRRLAGVKRGDAANDPN
jgi:hypothetical protein